METRGLTQGQMLEAELDLMEFSDGQYSHLQRIIPADMEAGTGPDGGLMSRAWPDVRDHPAAGTVTDVPGPTLTSPLATTQAIDLSVAPEDHSPVIPGQKTPASFAEVPAFVLAGMGGDRSPTKVSFKSRASSQVPGQRFSARVCLEKRFNTMAVDLQRQRDVQSEAVCHFVKIFQQPGNVQKTLCPHMQKWMKTEGAGLLGVSSPAKAGGVFNPVTTMCAQMVDHSPPTVDPNKHQDDVVSPAVTRKWGHRSKQRARPSMSLLQSRERHNSLERERRKMIRLYCDKLNMLVPFCQSGTDRVTTLQWTTAFLVYLNKMYGDTFKKEFQKSFNDAKELCLKSSSSSSSDSFQQERETFI
ncbi:uncharacterized protein LOC128441912 [Pleuronectes platessa]|uniref:uncharacterized protein LOC128441912 n=1 Tax=Pleuronectes platessa TaxID=8262 RepID=UPI00232A5281|nr:uncharacterized protein LOC128441912 [Pleuronectes platessa]